MLRQRILLFGLSAFIITWGASARPATARSSSLDTHNHTPWQSIGPAPPTIGAIAADAKSHTIYVGSVGGGVIKSTDGGVTFRAVNNGLAGLTITGLAHVAHQPQGGLCQYTVLTASSRPSMAERIGPAAIGAV